jgi:hypothetical protein
LGKALASFGRLQTSTLICQEQLLKQQQM